MISDTLHDARLEIERYLASPVFAEVYDPSKCAERPRIDALLIEMAAIQRSLDNPFESYP